MKLNWAALCAMCLCVEGAEAHPYHDSQTEIDYRDGCECLEIAIRLKPEDLEAALTRATRKRLPLEDDRVQADLRRYVLERFAIAAADEKPIAMDWVGTQIDALGAWVYLQSKTVQLPVRLRDELLLEHEPQQINHVVFRVADIKQVLSFSSVEPVWQWLRAPQ